MEQQPTTHATLACGKPAAILPAVAARQPFTAPKLTFVKLELVRQGSLADVTAGLFGTFIP